MNVLTRTIAICAALWCAQVVTHGQPAEEPREAVLIQGSDLDAVTEAVCAAGGEITHQLGIINAVGARMTRTQVRELEASDDTLRIRTDRKAKVDSQQTAAHSVAHAPQPRTFTHLRHDPDAPDSLSGDRVRVIRETENGSIWVGTYDGGLTRMEAGTGNMTRFSHDPDDPTSLSDDKVMALYADADGHIWVGTFEMGLDRFDPRTSPPAWLIAYAMPWKAIDSSLGMGTRLGWAELFGRIQLLSLHPACPDAVHLGTGSRPGRSGALPGQIEWSEPVDRGGGHT